MDKKNIIILVVAVLIAGGIGYYAGKNAGASSAQANNSAQGSGYQGGQGGGRRNGGQSGGFVNGDVLSKDAQSITISMRSGGSKIVFYAPSTQITKMGPGTIDDIQVGTGVMVQGAANSDGSVNAQSISIRPQRQDQGQGGQAGTSTGVHETDAPAPQGN